MEKWIRHVYNDEQYNGIIYKVTDSFWRGDGYIWGTGSTHKVNSCVRDAELFTNHWIHAYENPFYAYLLDPVYSNINSNIVIWRCQGESIRRLVTGIIGCKRITTLDIIPKPTMTLRSRIKIAALLALKVCFLECFKVFVNDFITINKRPISNCSYFLFESLPSEVFSGPHDNYIDNGVCAAYNTALAIEGYYDCAKTLSYVHNAVASSIVYSLVALKQDARLKSDFIDTIKIVLKN